MLPIVPRWVLAPALLVFALATFTPRSAASDPGSGPSLANHWSLQPLVKPTPPTVTSDWARTEIDRFVLARLEAAGVAPAPDATPEVLLKRLHLLLHGLSPSPEETASFVDLWAWGPQLALDNAIPALLKSDRFGEHWGRSWIHLTRSAESTPKSPDTLYRDYVIEAFNLDIPYDAFLVEQIAGDLLDACCATETDRLAAATCFLNLASNPESDGDSPSVVELTGDQLDTLSKAVLALPSLPAPGTEAVSTGPDGRLQLARWITGPQSPLTARVAANRIWMHLFGSGLVATPDDFGVSGDPPSHPELLDYLAARLIELNWSCKALIREILSSRTSQLATTSIAFGDSPAVEPGSQNVARTSVRAIAD